MNRYVTIAATVAALALPSVSMAEDMKTGMDGMDMGKPGGPADKAYDESMRKMMKDMMTKPTGDPDKDFVTMMMPHHQGAIDMAKVELRYGKDPMLRKLAGDIVKAQEKEIAEMKGWQAKTGK